MMTTESKSIRTKKPVGFRFSKTTKKKLLTLARLEKCSQTRVLEDMVREKYAAKTGD